MDFGFNKVGRNMKSQHSYVDLGIGYFLRTFVQLCPGPFVYRKIFRYMNKYNMYRMYVE